MTRRSSLAIGPSVCFAAAHKRTLPWCLLLRAERILVLHGGGGQGGGYRINFGEDRRYPITFGKDVCVVVGEGGGT